MNHSLPILALFAALSLAACDKPTVVSVPATPSTVPGPAGATGATGNTGATGATGNSGSGTTVIVTPPASAPSN